MNRNGDKIIYADDDTESVGLLLKLRLPWLLLGALGGVLATFVVSWFEDVLSSNLSLAFFIPFIVYMSGAVASQTETIYVRNLADKRINFKRYLDKELFIGFILGLILGFLVGVFAYFWPGGRETAITVGLAMFVNVLIAPWVGLFTSQILFKERSDPALGAGPVTAVIQDILSLAIYFLIAALIIF